MMDEFSNTPPTDRPEPPSCLVNLFIGDLIAPGKGLEAITVGTLREFEFLFPRLYQGTYCYLQE